MNKAEVLKKLEIFNDDKFVFVEDVHKYYYDGVELTSATTFLKNFCIPFDEQYWSAKKAKDEGITQEEMLEKWDKIRNDACDVGNRLHLYIENFYENKSECRIDEDIKHRINEFHRMDNDFLSKMDSIGSEIKCFLLKYGICGTMDKLYLYKNTLIIGDWKSSKVISTDDDFAFNYLLPPFEKYKENEYNKYSIQTSLYALMLEEIGLRIGYCFIAHIPKEGEYKIHRMRDFRKELKKYLEMLDFKKELKKYLDENKKWLLNQ